MKLIELKNVLYSEQGHMQLGKLYNRTTNNILHEGCSVDYMVAHFSHMEVERITADDSEVVITVSMPEELEQAYIGGASV